jgi:hypothetical protein
VNDSAVQLLARFDTERDNVPRSLPLARFEAKERGEPGTQPCCSYFNRVIAIEANALEGEKLTAPIAQRTDALDTGTTETDAFVGLTIDGTGKLLFGEHVREGELITSHTPARRALRLRKLNPVDCEPRLHTHSSQAGLPVRRGAYAPLERVKGSADRALERTTRLRDRAVGALEEELIEHATRAASVLSALEG